MVRAQAQSSVSIQTLRSAGRFSRDIIKYESYRLAQFEKRHLRSVLSEDPDVSAILKPENIATLFEPANYLGSAGTFIDAVLAAARPQVTSTPSVKG